jgi:CHAT domain-containing protein
LIGLTYSELDDFNNSEKYSKISLESKINNIPIDTLGLAISMNNLGILYKNKGMNSKALEYLLESIELKKKINSIKDLEYAYTLSNLGSLYLDLENSKSALRYQLEAVKIIKNIYGENSVKYAGVLNNLGKCYGDDYEKAKNIYLKVKEIQLNLLGANHPNYSVTLNNLGDVYSSMKNYNISEKYFKESINIQLRVYGESHHLYITSIQNLGWLYYKTSKIDSSEKYLSKALDLKIKKYGEKDASLISTKEQLTLLYLKKGDTLIAKKYIDEAVTSSYDIIKNGFYFLTDKEKLTFLSKFENIYNLYNSIYFISKNDDYSKLFDLSIINKGIVLKNSNLIEQKAKIINDTLYFALINGVKELKTKLSKLYTDENFNSTELIQNIKDEIYKKERTLTEHASLYVKNNNFLKFKWQDIKNKLKKNEVAIEIISFNSNKDFDNKNDSTYYIALILKEYYKVPELVFLFEEEQINILSKDNSPEILNNIYNNLDFYNLFWGKLSNYLNDGETVFVSPSGLLNNYNFKTQKLSNDQLIGEKYKIHMLNSIEEIISYDEEKNIKDKVSSLYLFGGVDFGNPKFKEFENVILNRSSKNYKWPFLYHSLIEASRIDSLVKNNSIKSYFYYGINAEEEKFKAISSSKVSNIIHVATHGYFIRNASIDIDQISNNANTSYNSGLILSRANEYPSNFSDNQLISNDGNLTSLEISNLNLEFCKLVVLSACETGLGEIEGNEGIFGLQRAFKIAGVKNIITSLWKVPDIQTSELMYLFYENLLNGDSISDALLKSQLNMSKKYPPYYWASFVLLE